jgi:purine-binding chemotaxis protein CheW
MPQELDPRTILHERARKLAQPAVQEKIRHERLVLCFKLSHEHFAVEHQHVREVFPLAHITEVPCTPPHIVGLTNVRGEIISVVDVKRFFGMPFAGLTNFNKVIVLSDGKGPMGLLVDEVTGTKTLDAMELLETLPTFSDARADFISAITREPLMLLDAERLMEDKRLMVEEEPRRDF